MFKRVSSENLCNLFEVYIVEEVEKVDFYRFYDFPRLPELSIINEEQRAICVPSDFGSCCQTKVESKKRVFDLDTCAVLFAHLHSGTSWANKLAPVEQPSRLDRTK
ncbi:hypothetical protein T12_1697 [Trichinella patagoniensis]|uniref:Uncharacterized protein n=1 Tax=Trichinella patagoniensis TaxID=990121 RepID=A0A0V0ZQ49_9BILA|nr:hypothetical protein T12_1697 [Trichinella patagoniensis]